MTKERCIALSFLATKKTPIIFHSHSNWLDTQNHVSRIYRDHSENVGLETWNVIQLYIRNSKVSCIPQFQLHLPGSWEGRACTKMGAALPSRGSQDSPRCWGRTSSAWNISSEWNRRIFSVREVILVAKKRRSGAWLCTPVLLDSLVPVEVWIAIRIVRGMRLHPPLASTFLPWNLSQCQSCMMCVKKPSAYNYNIIQLFC